MQQYGLSVKWTEQRNLLRSDFYVTTEGPLAEVRAFWSLFKDPAILGE